MPRELKFAIRIDDPPWSDEAEEIENFAKVARKYRAPFTLAICSGFLNDLPQLQETYKNYHKEGLIKLGCHGWNHEDFTGLDRQGYRLGKPMLEKGVEGASADKVIKRCQDFAQSLFGERYKLWVNPGREFDPVFPDEYYTRLVKHGFTVMSSNATADPLIEPFERFKGLYDVRPTIYYDFYKRRGLPTPYTPEKFSWYMEAVKNNVRTRFMCGLYVCLLTHAIDFDEKPDPYFGFAGNNPGGRFLDELLPWVIKEYPEVEFVGVQDLVPRQD